jgi:BirA family biotin operon repressor/biotin-[acetyl-CoA-carboxylase] ligase
MLGIGINIGPASFPPELVDRAGAIETESPRADAGAVLAHVLAALNRVLSEVEHAGPPSLFTRWLELAPSAYARVEWDGPHGVQSGVSAGLAEDGALLARTVDGLARIIAGEYAGCNEAFKAGGDHDRCQWSPVAVAAASERRERATEPGASR